jgi:hypothetical protein
MKKNPFFSRFVAAGLALALLPVPAHPQQCALQGGEPLKPIGNRIEYRAGDGEDALCGFEAFANPQTPAKRYKRRSTTGSMSVDTFINPPSGGQSGVWRNVGAPGGGTAGGLSVALQFQRDISHPVPGQARYRIRATWSGAFTRGTNIFLSSYIDGAWNDDVAHWTPSNYPTGIGYYSRHRFDSTPHTVGASEMGKLYEMAFLHRSGGLTVQVGNRAGWTVSANLGTSSRITHPICPTPAYRSSQTRASDSSTARRPPVRSTNARPTPTAPVSKREISIPRSSRSRPPERRWAGTGARTTAPAATPRSPA